MSSSENGLGKSASNIIQEIFDRNLWGYGVSRRYGVKISRKKHVGNWNSLRLQAR
jgi:hypothetical protein